MSVDSFKQFIKNTVKQQRKTRQVSSAKIVAIGNQGAGVDYYDVEINGKIFKQVPCPLPSWLISQIAHVTNIRNSLTTYASQRTYVGIQYDASSRVKTTFDREPLFSVGDNVEVTFEDGNQSLPKITLELSGKKYKELTIYYV